MLSRSITKPVWAEAHVSQLAALRAFSDVLSELLRVERLHRAVLAPDAGHGERLAIRDRDISQGDIFGKGNELNPYAAVRPLGHFGQLEEQQPRVGRERREILAPVLELAAHALHPTAAMHADQRRERPRPLRQVQVARKRNAGKPCTSLRVPTIVT